MTDAHRLYAAFRARWLIQHHHPWRARLARVPRIRALLDQRLGRHRWTDVPLFHGRRMRVLTGETVSRALISFGYSEPDLTALLCELVRPGSAVVDIGAHFGYEAMLMAELVGPDGRVDAFEPNPAVAAIARRNLAAWPMTVLHTVALGAANERAGFEFPELARSSFGGLTARTDGTVSEVEVRTLDDAGLPEAVDLIKCDAEGRESEILSGGARILATRPSLILETGMETPEGLAPALVRIMAQLAPLGYHPLVFRFRADLEIAPPGSFRTGHANTLFLPDEHPRLPQFLRGWRRAAD